MSTNNPNFIIFALQSYGPPLLKLRRTWYTFAEAMAYTVHLRQGYGVQGRLTEWPGSGLQNRLPPSLSLDKLGISNGGQRRRFEPTERSEGASDPAKRESNRLNEVRELARRKPSNPPPRELRVVFVKFF